MYIVTYQVKNNYFAPKTYYKSIFIPVITEQEIDENALQVLDIDCLKELIPKMGPRVKFGAKLKQYQELMKMPILIQDTESTVSDKNVDVS